MGLRIEMQLLYNIDSILYHGTEQPCVLFLRIYKNRNIMPAYQLMIDEKMPIILISKELYSNSFLYTTQINNFMKQIYFMSLPYLQIKNYDVKQIMA